MASTIKQLYNGELRPSEKVVRNHDYQLLRGDFFRHKDTFCKKLEEQAPELYERFSSLMEDLKLMHIIEMEDMFVHGFSLGMTLLSEAHIQ